ADWIKVIFLPDYRVSLAEQIIPAADVSEQLSTAGMEASGAGNMKFALNGALTVGTLDGANIEIMEEVGAENISIFVLSAQEIGTRREQGKYRPGEYYEGYPALGRVLDALHTNVFAPHEPGLWHWLYEALLQPGEPYFHLADLPSYIETQARVGNEYSHRALWARKVILNVARMGKFSSDRTILEYASDIWQIQRTTEGTGTLRDFTSLELPYVGEA